MSVPGIGFTAATTILAEIGDYRDFSSPNKLAAWCGLVPSVYQSADKVLTGSITKQGSKHIRWILVQVAQAAAKKKFLVDVNSANFILLLLHILTWPDMGRC